MIGMEAIVLGTKEHYDILDNFEREHGHMRLDREPTDQWSHGHVYQSGETNNAYREYLAGYMLGRCVYLHGGN